MDMSSSGVGSSAEIVCESDLYVRRSKTCFVDRAFSAAGPKRWKSLPPSIPSADSVESFKIKLRHFLLTKAYPD